jgi:magnesium-transporting ATPase (P-type)
LDDVAWTAAPTNSVTTRAAPPSDVARRPAELNDEALLQLEQAAPEQSLAALGTSLAGLSADEVAVRLREHGPNVIATRRRRTAVSELIASFRGPLNALLLALAMASWLLGDHRASILILTMILLSVLLAFVQEHRAGRAAAALRLLVRTHATARRSAPERTFRSKTSCPATSWSIAALLGYAALVQAVKAWAARGIVDYAIASMCSR